MVRKAQILMMDLLEKNVGMQSRFLRPNVAKAKIRIGKKWYSHDVIKAHFNSLINFVAFIYQKLQESYDICPMSMHHSCVAHLISNRWQILDLMPFL